MSAFIPHPLLIMRMSNAQPLPRTRARGHFHPAFIHVANSFLNKMSFESKNTSTLQQFVECWWIESRECKFPMYNLQISNPNEWLDKTGNKEPESHLFYWQPNPIDLYFEGKQFTKHQSNLWNKSPKYISIAIKGNLIRTRQFSFCKLKT